MEYTRLAGETDDYRQARDRLRLAEIDLMEQREQVAAQRRALPAGPTVEDYTFLEGPADLDAGDAPVAEVRLSELFSAPDRALILYHLMYGKLQTSPCPMCTMWIDGFDAVDRHLQRSVDFAIVAAADLPTLRAHGRARGWQHLRLLSAGASSFKYDLGSEDADGNQESTISVFTLDADRTPRHAYTAKPNSSDTLQERGIDLLTPVWSMLDLTPVGRGEWYPDLRY